jgi:hypothetical protein
MLTAKYFKNQLESVKTLVCVSLGSGSHQGGALPEPALDMALHWMQIAGQHLPGDLACAFKQTRVAFKVCKTQHR